MKNLRTSPAAKTVAVLLALVVITGGFWASFFTLSQWDDLWYGNGYYDSNNCYVNMYSRYRQAEQLLTQNQQEVWNGSLTYLEQQRLSELTETLRAENTNFRFQAVDNTTGTLVYSNLTPGTELEQAVHEILWDSLELSEPSYDSADVSWDGETADGAQLRLNLKSGERLIFHSESDADREAAGQYGWTFSFDGGWAYEPAQDTRGHYAALAVGFGVTNPISVQDEFYEGLQDYNQFAQYLPTVAVLALVLDIAAVLVLVFLCLAAGRHRDREAAVCNGFDRIPLDLLIVLEILAIAILLNGGDAISYAATLALTPDVLVGLAVISLAIVGCLLALILSLATRIKTRTVFSNTFIWMLCRAIGRGCGRAAASWPLTGRTVVLFLLYLLGTFLTTLTIFLIPVYQGLVLWALCRWTIQWKKIRTGTAEIVGGNPDYKIDTVKMFRDLKEHAEALNDLGAAIGSAVDERMKSERFKTELITNVSHDLKTPLTSIINYVDLLKKEEVDSPKAAEYIEVLDRKSQRLKKLTEDLVEASKASTGTLTVNRERLGMGQLVRQALGEYEEKFSARRLELLPSLPEAELYVDADGRHVWRILDNLLGNCHKYALEGTRVYLELRRWEGKVTLSIKNISQNALNIPPEQLMERFVRGDESRTSEGSGLGLSIARSLTELQGGIFRLDIDGDLFKASISFPESALPIA